MREPLAKGRTAVKVDPSRRHFRRRRFRISARRVGRPLRELSGRFVPAATCAAAGDRRDLPLRARCRRRRRRGRCAARSAPRRSRPLRARARRDRRGPAAVRSTVRGARRRDRPSRAAAGAVPRPPLRVPPGRGHASLRELGRRSSTTAAARPIRSAAFCSASIGTTIAAALAWSDAICTALQLANFWQDIAVDWTKGRVYLPQEDLARFGVTEAQIAEGRCDDAWRALVAFETARTRALLESGRPLVRALPWRAGLELAGVLAGGHRDPRPHRRRRRRRLPPTAAAFPDRLGAGRLPCACATAPPSRRAGGNDGMSAAGPPQGGSRATTTSAASVGAHA